MRVKYNKFGEVVSVNGLTTGQHLGTPMQDALGNTQENSQYSTQFNIVSNCNNFFNDDQPKSVTSMDTPTDVKFFDIDYDGIISLKPEYRGRPGSAEDVFPYPTNYPYAISDNGVGLDGSKIHELPEKIVIPEVINGTAVTGFQNGMFYFNLQVTEVTIPDTVNVIPEYFCFQAKNFVTVKNTGHITNVGKFAFAYTRVEKALFPNLTMLDKSAFNSASYLCIVDIGDNVTTILSQTFRNCFRLSHVKGGKNVTTLEKEAFMGTRNLKNLSFLPQLTSIGNSAFLLSRIQFDWSTLTKCTFGTYATPVIDNTTDYWSGSTFTPCKQPLNSLLCQTDPRWANETYGDTEQPFSDACAFFTMLHMHSALSGKVYNTPQQFEEELRELGFDMSEEARGSTVVANMAKTLGYKATIYSGNITTASYQVLLDKLAEGAYARIESSVANNANQGHSIMAYGVNEIGEVLIADSGTQYGSFGIYEPSAYSVPFQNTTGPASGFVIVEKQ